MFKKILNFICSFYIIKPKYNYSEYLDNVLKRQLEEEKANTKYTCKISPLHFEINELRKAIKKTDDIIFDFNSSDDNDNDYLYDNGYEYDHYMNYWLSKRQRQQAWLAKLLRKKSRITGSDLDAIEARKLEILSGITLDKYTKRQMNGSNK